MVRSLPFSRVARGSGGARLLAAFALVAAAAGCDCGAKGLKGAGPVISVDPTSLTLAGTPSTDPEHPHVTEAIIRVSNIGNGALQLEKAPWFDEKDNDGVEEFGVASLFEKGCDEQPRPAATRQVIEPGACAQLVIRYSPNADGLDTTDLHLQSNDAETPDLVIPINAGALTPVLEVCSYKDGTLEGCGGPPATFEVDFGMASPGTAVTRTLRITSKGSGPLHIEGMHSSGDDDFKIAPETMDKTLAPGESTDVTVTFDALSGGGRERDLVLENNVPSMPKYTVRLLAVGDASRLCFCVGSETERCAPAATADFGKVPINGEGHKFLLLSSCGTKPLTLKQADVTAGGPVFSAVPPNLGGGLVLAPGATPINVPLVFKPNAEQKFTGRLTLETDAEHGFVNLVGEGVESGCKLESASSTIDFGTVAQLVEARKDYTVANRGTTDCIIPRAPTITQGANVKFGLVGFPAVPSVQPGQTVKFTVSYTPQDDAPPDLGELTIPYGDAAGGVATADLKVQLKGTPTTTPKCVLTANPGGSSAFGRTLNFGQVRVNSEKILPVTFQNTGSSPCQISSTKLQGPPPFPPGLPNDLPAFRIKTMPKTTLQPAETTVAEIGFTPSSDRAFGSSLPGFPGGSSFGVSLLVTTSDTASFNGQACAGFGGSGTPGCVAWALSGTGVKSDLHVLPEDVDFGKVTLGCRSREEKVTIYNTGAAPLNIKSIKVDPQPPPEIFKVVTQQTPPFVLAGGAQTTISVRYRPPDASIHTGTIYIESDATNVSGGNPFTTVGLRGEGTTESHQTDTFDQASRPKTDVLFVVDNSGSMSEEQNSLASNASTFIGVAQQLNTDFQIAVVTTDMDDAKQSGIFQGNPKIIKNGSSAAGDFARTVRGLGTNGSSEERGLDAMVAALTDPLINDPNKNKGFLRPDAKLAVVEISDEDDQSRGTVDFYTDFLKNIKGSHNSSLVTLSAIVGDAPNGCATAEAGNRYLTVQQRTLGKFRSICSADWGQIAADLGLDAFASRAGFPLSRQADPPTIVVHVNGQLRPNSEWTYDATANTVVFNANALPAAGATVVIDYEALCL